MFHRYHNTAARLAAWRAHAKEMAALYVKRGEPVPAEYATPSLPPNYFGQVSEDTPHREEGKTPTYNYGEGLGGKTRRPFRFVGFADEVTDARIRHTGWYGDDEGSGFNMFRGVVFQIPARGGNTQYLAGCEWGEQGAKGKFETGGGWIEIGRGDIYESKEDAARAADSIAERAAETARDEDRAEREKEAEAEREREEAAEREEAEHAAAVAAALESTLKLAGEVCNATGEPGTVSEPMRALIGKLEDALHEYDSLTADAAGVDDEE